MVQKGRSMVTTVSMTLDAGQRESEDCDFVTVQNVVHVHIMQTPVWDAIQQQKFDKRFVAGWDGGAFYRGIMTGFGTLPCVKR